MSDNIFLKSKFKPGDSVSFQTDKELFVDCFVRAVMHTETKVKYSLYLKNMKTVIHNIDSALVSGYN